MREVLPAILGGILLAGALQGCSMYGLLQQAIELAGGYVFQIVGDAFCVAFHTASEGIAAALAAQRALTTEPWGETGPVRVRMALHTGTADLHAGEHKSGEYVSGLTLSHAARLLSVAYGGQILVSNATQELVRNDLPSRVGLRNLGRHRLRDLAHAEHIYQVVAPDLPDVFPALKWVEAVPNNLPRRPAMRCHFPLTLPSKQAAESYPASIQREQPDARLVNLRRRAGGWAACLSTADRSANSEGWLCAKD